MAWARVQALAGLGLVTVVLSGCSAEPVEPAPGRDAGPPAPLLATAPGTCEKTWDMAVDGDWSEPGRWTPSGVPSITDEVCFTAAGTYEISASIRGYADSIYVGPGVDLTFRTGGSSGIIEVEEEVVVAPGGAVTIAGTLELRTRDLLSDGTVTTEDDGYLIVSDRFENRGAFAPSGYLITSSDYFLNDGDLVVNQQAAIACRVRCEMVGGQVMGTGTVELGGGVVGGAEVVWSGTSLPPRVNAGDAAQVFVFGADLVLASTGLVGAIDIFGSSNAVRGDIGPSVDLQLLGNGGAPPQLLPAPATPAAAMVNDGVLRLGKAPFYGSPVFEVDAVHGLVNRGRLEIVAQPVRLTGKAFENRGTVVLDERFTLATTDARNAGEVTRGTSSDGTLELASGTLSLGAGSTIVVPVTVFAGTLGGTGSADSVVVRSGSVAPGPGIGTLTLGALVMEPWATLKLEVAGPSHFDRIRVNGPAILAGTLEVRSIGSYVGGVCGQVLPMVTHRNSLSGQPAGGFAWFANLPGGLGRQWRAHYATDTVLVAGYDPRMALGSTTSLATLAEGGTTATADFCLGVPAITTPITATLSASRAQVTATPSNLVFTATDYALPRRVRFTAIDDAVSEGPHRDTVRVAVTPAGAVLGATAAPVFAINDNEPAVDLAVTMVSANNPVSPSQTIERRFRVTNNGPGASTGSTFFIQGLSGPTFLANSTGANCAMAGGNLACAVGALAPGSSFEFVVLFTSPATPGSYTNTLRIRGNEWDNVGANDGVPWVLTVN